MPEIAPIALNPASLPDIQDQPTSSAGNSEFSSILAQKMADDRASTPSAKTTSQTDSQETGMNADASMAGFSALNAGGAFSKKTQTLTGDDPSPEKSASVTVQEELIRLSFQLPPQAMINGNVTAGLSEQDPQLTDQPAGGDSPLSLFALAKTPLQFSELAKIITGKDLDTTTVLEQPASSTSFWKAVSTMQNSAETKVSSNLTIATNTVSDQVLGIQSSQLEQLLADTKSQGTLTIQLASGMTTLEDLKSLTPPAGIASDSIPIQATAPIKTSTGQINTAVFAEATSLPIQSPVLVTETSKPSLLPEGVTTQQAVFLAQDSTAAASPSASLATPSVDTVNAAEQEKHADQAMEAFDQLFSEMKAKNSEQKKFSADQADTPSANSSTNQHKTSANDSSIANLSQATPTDTAPSSLPVSSLAQSTQISIGHPEHLPGQGAVNVASYAGSMISENALFEQIQARFQMNSKLNDSHLSLKLHPAELGSLKIDLSVKDGVIRAHVVAQSSQVQEILEKNMPKLKSILEGQGFAVEDIQVRHQNDNVTDFSFFDEQFSRDQSPAFSQNTKNNGPSFATHLEESATDGYPRTNGVNIEA